MATINNIFIVLCITGGCTAFIATVIGIINTKSGAATEGPARWRFWGLVISFITACILIILGGGLLPVLTAIISGCLTLQGFNRQVKRKLHQKKSVTALKQSHYGTALLLLFCLTGNHAWSQNTALEKEAAPRFWQGIHYGSQLQVGAGNNRTGVGLESRITLHGSIFWGYAEAFVSVPSFIKMGDATWNGAELNGRHRFETGVRVYPFNTKPCAVRPFVGASVRLLPEAVVKGEELVVADRLVLPLQAGVTYRKKRMFLTVGVQYAGGAGAVMLQFNRTRRAR